MSLKIFAIAFVLLAVVVTLSAKEVEGANTLVQIVKIEDTFVADVNTQNFTISPSLSDISKTVVFLTFNHDNENDGSDTFRGWNITDASTLTLYGSDHAGADNNELDFIAYLVEFSGDVDVQQQVLNLPASPTIPVNSTMSAVNTTSSVILFSGFALHAFDSAIGSEEMNRVRIINSTTWEFDVFDPQDVGDQDNYVQIVDFDGNGVSVQRGQGVLTSSETTDTFTPPTAINGSQTMLFVTFNLDGALSAEPKCCAIGGTINPSDEIVISRFEATDEILYNWEVIEFPEDFATVQHGTIVIADASATDTDTITAVGNLTNSFVTGTVQTPFGHQSGTSEDSDEGAWNDVMTTLELTADDTVTAIRGGTNKELTLGYQVVEVLAVQTGQNLTQNILDVATVVDVSTNKNVTKLTTDAITSSDTVSTNVVFVIELSDTGDVLDVISLNITKLNADTVTALDETNFNITKGLIDSATILDLVDTSLITSIELLDTTNVNDELQFEITKALTDLSSVLDDPDKDIEKTIADITTIVDQTDTSIITQILELDTVNANDEVRLEIIKTILDVVANSDELNFSLNKLLADTASVSDLIQSDTDFGVDELDLITANDLVILDVTRQLSDVASAIDDLNLTPTKVFLDTTTVSDTAQAQKEADRDIEDPVGTADDLVIDVSKLIQDVSTVQDDIVLVRLVDIAINDTVTIEDPAIFFTIATQVPNGTGTAPSASGGGGVPTFQRLVGLSILSELFNVVPQDNVPSDFVISTFGLMQQDVKIEEIAPDQQFQSWFQFQIFPTTLDFDTEVDNTRTVNDPARFKNTALESFVLTVPEVSCSGLDPFESVVPCIDPLVYEVPLTFTFSKGGVDFKEKHIVTVDATERIECDIICQIVNFLVENYWWLAGIVVVFMMMYFLGGAIRNRGVRTARRFEKRHFESFSADRPKRKFKRGKGR